ncbi:MAG: FecR domain-containing protein [Bacteroidales bacterium]
MNEDIYSIIIDLLTENIESAGRKRLKEWLNESPQNKEEYKHICEIWYASRWARYIAYISKNGAWNIIKLKREKEQYRKKLYYVSSIAASIVILFGVLFTIGNIEDKEYYNAPQVLAQTSPYSLQNINPILVLASGTSIDLLRSPEKNHLEDRGVSINIDSTSLAYTTGSKFRLKKGGFNEVLVPKCREMKVALADGTVVYMNSFSRLRFPVEFTGKTREVYLDGEAYFDVAEDAGHPFIVHTNKTDVKVLGTEFNVMTYANEEDTQVTLIKGLVNVKVADNYTNIKPGEQISINNKSLKEEVKTVDVNKYIAWREGLYKFESASLEQLLKYMERRYDISYFFERDSVKWLRFTGAFNHKSSVEEIFGMIEQMTDVKFEMQQVKFEMQEGRKILIK